MPIGTIGSRPDTPGGPRYGYAIPPDSVDSMAALAGLVRDGFNVAVATEPFRAAGREFPRGSAIVRLERNPAALGERIARAGTTVYDLDSARVETGPDLGEDPIVELVKPRIAVITDEPTDDRSYGATWFTLERRLGYPFTALKTDMVRGADLRRYDVVVFPHGSPARYQEMLGEPGIAKLRRWTEDGGTLVLIKGAAAMATRRGVEWTTSTLKRDQATIRLFFDPPQAGRSGEDRQEARRSGEGIQETRRSGGNTQAGARSGEQGALAAAAQKDSPAAAGETAEGAPPTRDIDLARTPGAILRVKVDPEHFLGFGYGGDTAATVQSNFAFTLSKTGQHAAAFPDATSVKLAGFMWPEVREAMARTLFAWVEPAGRGNVILFADDPNFRATQLSTLRMFFNAVFLGPSFARRF